MPAREATQLVHRSRPVGQGEPLCQIDLDSTTNPPLPGQEAVFRLPDSLTEGFEGRRGSLDDPAGTGLLTARLVLSRDEVWADKVRRRTRAQYSEIDLLQQCDGLLEEVSASYFTQATKTFPPIHFL